MSIDALPLVILVPIALPVALLLVLGWVAMVLRELLEADTFTVSVEHTVLHSHADTDVDHAEQHDRTDEAEQKHRAEVIHAGIVARGSDA